MLDSLDTLIAFVLIMLLVSLLITIAVQIISSLLNLRGINLAKGLAATFAVMAPGIEERAKELTRTVLKGDLLSDSFLPDWPVIRCWRHTAAVRPDELFDAIHRIATGRCSVEPAIRETAQTLLVALGFDKKKLNEAATKIDAAHAQAKALTDAAKKALETVSDPAVRAKVQTVLDDAAAKVAAYESAAASATAAAAGSIDAAYKRFHYWIEICQERVQQWFTMNTRLVTVAFAIIFAFWLQLDTVEIFRLVSSNRAVRDKLVAQAGVIEAQARRAFENSNVLKDALKDWSSEQTDPAIAKLLLSVDVSDTDTRESVKNKVIRTLAGRKPVDTFDSVVMATATQRVNEQTADFADVKADFQKTGFDLFPTNSRFRWGKSWWDGFAEHFAGIIFSVGLLSLGAPFWYNALKNLSSLRSTVAQNIAEEKKQERQSEPGASQASLAGARPAVTAPPTTK